MWNRQLLLPMSLFITGYFCMNKTMSATPAACRSEVVKKLEDYLKSAVQTEHFTGVALVALHDTILLNKGFGQIGTDEPITKDTVFHIASLTKQFTAAAILKLWQIGKVDLHASINKYLLPEHQSNTWNNVTIHHLLSHTSGIPDDNEKYYGPEMFGFVFGDTIKTMVQEAGNKKLEFEPGSAWNYCNMGYTILGLIIEHQTGCSYESVIQDFFVTPLKMTSTGFHDKNYTPEKDHAKGYRWDEKRAAWVEDHKDKIVTTMSDGNMFSTDADLYTWSKVLLGRRPNVLSDELVTLMTTPVPNTQSEQGYYGYGLWVDNSSGILRIHHSGWMPGFMCDFILYPEKELFVCVLANNTTVDTAKIVHILVETISE